MFIWAADYVRGNLGSASSLVSGEIDFVLLLELMDSANEESNAGISLNSIKNQKLLSSTRSALMGQSKSSIY